MSQTQSVRLDKNHGSLVRKAQELKRIARALSVAGVGGWEACQAVLEGDESEQFEGANNFLNNLSADERHYWLSSLYAILLSPARRNRLATYFTPPHLADYLIGVMEKYGLQIGRDRILDPASGGAAFMVPLAKRIINESDLSTNELKEVVSRTLHGIEIEPHLARLSKALLRDAIYMHRGVEACDLEPVIICGNTLSRDEPEHLYDAIIGNPPYGRIYRPSKTKRARFPKASGEGYANLYALFIEQSLRWVRPGGLIGLIVPTSFIGGPYYQTLRRYILETAEVLQIDQIQMRSDVFVDVKHDICVFVIRRKTFCGQDSTQRSMPTSALVRSDGSVEDLGTIDIPGEPSGRVWALPVLGSRASLFSGGLWTLETYGYHIRTGSFVWNRERERYRPGNQPRENEVPLFWAHNIKADELCQPFARKGGTNDGPVGFVSVVSGSPTVHISDSLLVQRTTNRAQRRRIVAGRVCVKNLPGGWGFIAENHTIVVFPKPNTLQAISLDQLCRLLNTQAVDLRFRRISGSVSVSTRALRDLPLPDPSAFLRNLSKELSVEEAARQAYLESVANAD